MVVWENFGRVFALRDEPEVCIVWLQNCDSRGLAMARAFGDFCLKNFGQISVPNVPFRRLTEKDEFIVLATDGLSLRLELGDTKYPTSKVDDCAAVCLYLHSNTTNAVSTASENDDASGLGGLGRSSTVRTGKEAVLDESEAEKAVKRRGNRTWKQSILH
ncbi:unnamed protein product [Eruca vesicaria subsp. sativa]|uniref:PPM-type phosphatase domain-containing protein n=1 Tax=Eruca vesicaria subsp. sativa TaxID=29727 RepID=A0ABC8LWK7_ERUVS|nr:unnamed protein product [Eruca vesicaria subsp. sativa]